MSTIEDIRFMARAIKLARRGMFTTDPNPRVGCVLVRDGQVVGEGFHLAAGGPHAEVNAIEAAGKAAKGAVAYVTLEPCCHTGRTGPCTERLIAAGVKTVVAAMRDPNPEVQGKGLEALEAAGVEVRQGTLEIEAAALNRGFISRMRRGRPYLRLKLAASLDGRTALSSGESKWITGADARRDVQRLRAQSSAVLTGVGTVLADDPRLDVREQFAPPDEFDAGDIRQPLRVVADSRLRTPADAKILSPPGRAMIATRSANLPAAEALKLAGAELVALPGEGDRVDLAGLLSLLARRGVNELHAECGPALAGTLLDAGLVDELVLYLAPAMLGANARPLALLDDIGAMADRREFCIAETRSVGDDLRLTLVPRANG